ncbi:radical SAM superfamily protein [mine drainage metagenome]|uniref:Radical SAM superfamily protein n=1 Tax=mine drainage metagenome TaxID=410659 RepID=A0A1J5S8M8_9ZZZZ
MSSEVRSVLYVRLPCWKIYPGGVIYVADYIHKQRPDIHQHLLDLALVPPARRRRVLKQRLVEMRPDVVAFSWRNMQSFGPHPEDDALDVVMNYDHSRSLWRRLKAVGDSLRIIADYVFSRLRNFGYMKLVRRQLPDARIVVGGTAVSIFGKYVAEKCPSDTVVVIGEGEDAMLAIVDGYAAPVGETFYKDRSGRISHRCRSETFDLRRLTAVDFAYVESIFPDFGSYLNGDIGVHTKRGCPFQCHFCLYNKIEGDHQRYREPAEIAKEVELLNKRYGVGHIWFTDAQFCSTKRSTEHVERVLDELLARNTAVSWSGYLRLNHLTPGIARKMLASGMSRVDLSFTGSQEMIDSLTLGYSLEQQMEAFRMLKASGHSHQQVKLYIPLNAPGETVATLQQTIDRIKELYALFGRERVLPFIFFIGVQPGTPVERLLIERGYLKPDYNPLTLNPFVIKKLLYNPKPLGRLIGRAYLEAAAAIDADSEYIGRATIDIIERELAGITA